MTIFDLTSLFHLINFPSKIEITYYQRPVMRFGVDTELLINRLFNCLLGAPTRARVPFTWVPVCLGTDVLVTFVWVRTNVRVAICPGGYLSRWLFVWVVICPGDQMSG